MGRTIELGKPPIAVEIKHSARARRLSLRVSRLDGKVGLTVPPRTAERVIMGFLHEREDWLRKHLADVAGPIAVGLGIALPFRGGTLRVTEGNVPRHVVDDGALILRRGPQPVAARVRGFLRTAARDVLAARSDHYAAMVGRTYSSLSIRDTRSRWGSCSSKGGLMYSWRLIMAPAEVLDYVAAHEVAHLVEMNHSAAFWSVVAGLMPDYQTHRRWLRTEGSALHQFRFD